MKRILLSLWAIGVIAIPAAGAEKRRPNVVIVLTDDQGYGDLSCHGNKVLRTPNIDGLHRQSVRLTNFHVDPTCSPTRSALLTGRYSSRTGVWHTVLGRSLLRKDEVTLADLFAAAGYRTAIFGKWHLGDNYPFRPQDRGFHETLVFGGGGIGNTQDHWGNRYFDDTYLLNGKPTKYKGYCTDVFFGAALKFIERHKEKPFLVSLATNAPHAPYNVAERYSKPFMDKGVPEPRARFYGMIRNIDENVGRLVKKLADLKLDRNTLLVFMTDNGTSGGYTPKAGQGFNAGMRGIKGSEYDGGHRVPCFLRWPGVLPAGRDVPQLTAHIDLLPTFLDLCGVKPAKRPAFDGVSLRPLLTGGKMAWRERTLFVHSQRIDHPKKWRKCAVMTDRWRLINGKELYDMRRDPGQKTDVAGDHPKVVAGLHKQYERWYADVSRRFGEYCEIILGSPREDPSTLTCHDWHSPTENVPFNHDIIRRMPKENGFWAVEIARAGKYRFTLRHQPAQNKFPLRAVTARVKVGEVERKVKVPDKATAVSVELGLKAGKTRLQTWLTEKDGTQRGAFYVEVRRLGE
jgi:arylsulfatase A-like enzyme